MGDSVNGCVAIRVCILFVDCIRTDHYGSETKQKQIDSNEELDKCVFVEYPIQNGARYQQTTSDEAEKSKRKPIE